MNDCAGCRHLDEAAGPGDAAPYYCVHPIYHAPIPDPECPPCNGAGFEPRFFPESILS